MVKHFVHTLLSNYLKHCTQVTITVSGISMNPTLTAGDLITLTTCDSYVPGDILVYQYKNDGLLVHRLLLIEETSDGSTLYHCKGDNAFRLETISYQNIIGKVIAVDSQTIFPWPEWKIKLSYAVHLQYKQCEHGVVQAKTTDIFKLYALLLQGEWDTNIFSHCQAILTAKNFCQAFDVPFRTLDQLIQATMAEY